MAWEDIPAGELRPGQRTNIPELPAGRYQIETIRLLSTPAVIQLKHPCHILSVTPFHANSGAFGGIVIVTARLMRKSD